MMMLHNPATTGINHTRYIYNTRAGSILAIDRPEIRTRARCVKSELFGDATAELSILFDWMGAFYGNSSCSFTTYSAMY